MKIIAVTSCPIGMAHTYMAAAALKKAGKKMGYDIKVETQGSMGIRDRLSKEEIASADLLIKATDIAAQEGERFDKVLSFKARTSKLIRNSEEILKQAVEFYEKSK